MDGHLRIHFVMHTLHRVDTTNTSYYLGTFIYYWCRCRCRCVVRVTNLAQNKNNKSESMTKLSMEIDGFRNNAQIELIVHDSKLRIYYECTICRMPLEMCAQHASVSCVCVCERQNRCSVRSVNITDPSNSYYNLINSIDNAWMRAEYIHASTVFSVVRMPARLLITI